MAQAAPDPSTPEAANDLEARRQAECARRWIAEITASEKWQRDYIDRCRKITKRYKKQHSDTDTARRFAMLWTNVQTIHPAVYARPPQPLVSRRFKDADPVGRAASEVLERSLSFSVDKQDLDGVLGTASQDYVLIARGQSWERYVPTHGPAVVPPPIILQVTTGPEGGSVYSDTEGNTYEADKVTEENGQFLHQPEGYEPVVWEESVTDYVNWEDFGTSVARTWDEVTFVWRRVYLGRDQLVKRFGERLGKLIPLDWGPIQQGKADDSARMLQKAAIYEIWDKSTKRVYWVSKSWSSRPLDERPDPLGLDGFFPCPRPLLGTLASDSLIPVPDYVFYQDQAEEIDVLTARIAVLEKALKVRGFYAGDIKTNLNNLLNSDTNTLIPVPEWQTLKDGGGVQGKIEWFPVDIVIKTLDACIAARKQLIEDVYQITGVADIMRGASDPRETAAAQGMKANWGSLRIRDKQKEMARFARDIIRIKAEVIAEKFSAETLKAMTGVKLPTAAEKAQAEAQVQQMMAQAQAQAAQQAQMAAQAPQQPGQPNPMMGHNGGPPMAPEIPDELAEVLRSPSWEDVEALLRNNALRQFRVDIETDSTIEPNETEEKAQTVELLSAISSMVQQWGPALQAQPELAPMVGELIKFALRRFRAGRTLEDVIDSTVDKLVAQAAKAPPPGAAPIDKTPVEVAQLDLATEQTKQQGENQRALIEAQTSAGEQSVQRQELQAKLYVLPRDPNPQVQA